jgi:multiple sugar transport system ATP-binding protein
MRPEDFEDASLVGDQSRGITFKTKIDVLESMGSEFYAYFVVDADKVTSRELEELASDAGAGDLPHQEGSQLTARLEPASQVRQGQEAELWFNSEHIHLFDPETGQTLLGSNGRASGGDAAAGSAAATPGGTGEAPAS